MKTGLGAKEQTLSEEECLGLLASVSIGRLGGSHRALPVVMTVRVDVVDGSLRIEPLLDAAFPFDVGSVVALEAGTLGTGLASEWIVQVQGFLRSTTTTVPQRSTASHSAPETYWLSPDVISGWSLEGGSNGSRQPEVEGVRR